MPCSFPEYQTSLFEPTPQSQRNAGLPKGGNPYGNGALVVVQARECPAHGEGGQVVSTEYGGEVLMMRNAESVLTVIRGTGERGVAAGEHLTAALQPERAVTTRLCRRSPIGFLSSLWCRPLTRGISSRRLRISRRCCRCRACRPICGPSRPRRLTIRRRRCLLL